MMKFGWIDLSRWSTVYMNKAKIKPPDIKSKKNPYQLQFVPLPICGKHESGLVAVLLLLMLHCEWVQKLKDMSHAEDAPPMTKLMWKLTNALKLGIMANCRLAHRVNMEFVRALLHGHWISPMDKLSVGAVLDLLRRWIGDVMAMFNMTQVRYYWCVHHQVRQMETYESPHLVLRGDWKWEHQFEEGAIGVQYEKDTTVCGKPLRSNSNNQRRMCSVKLGKMQYVGIESPQECLIMVECEGGVDKEWWKRMMTGRHVICRNGKRKVTGAIFYHEDRLMAALLRADVESALCTKAVWQLYNTKTGEMELRKRMDRKNCKAMILRSFVQCVCEEENDESTAQCPKCGRVVHLGCTGWMERRHWKGERCIFCSPDQFTWG